MSARTPRDLDQLLALLDSGAGGSTTINGVTAVVTGDGLEATFNPATGIVTLQLSLAPDAGLLTSAAGLALGMPGPLSATSPSAVLGTTHTHAISASSNPGASSQLLKTDAAGRLFLEQLVLAGGGFSLVDQVTGDTYELAVQSGQLYLIPQ